MRAKEYIEQNQSSIKHLGDIKRIISDLMPLRRSKEATGVYFNQVLTADIRKQNYLLQKDLYEKKNIMQQQKPELESFPNEIPIEKSVELRDVLFQVIKEDDSFGYLFFLLGTEKNSKHFNDPIDCIPNAEKIDMAISRCRDDYPKNSLDDYLNDDLNYQQYNYLISKCSYIDDSEALLHFFNHSYLIYDEIRCHKSKLSKLHQYCNQLSFTDDKDKFFELSFVCSLIETFESEDMQLKHCRTELLKIINPLKTNYLPQSDGTTHSKIYLNSTKGYKLNYIRVINSFKFRR